MQNASGKQCLIATSLLVVILVATDADAKERGMKTRAGRNDRTTRRRESAAALTRSRFHDNPISLRRFSIFTTLFELAAGSIADGHSKYSRNLRFTLAARGKPGGKDARGAKGKDSSARSSDGGANYR